MQSDLLQREAALAKRFGPMGILIDGKLTETRRIWQGVMETAQERYGKWGRFEDDDAFRYACARLNKIDALIRDLPTLPQGEEAPFATLAALRAITEGDVQADWKAYCRGGFDNDVPGRFANVHTGVMADPTYDPHKMRGIDLALYFLAGAAIWLGVIITAFAYLR